MRPVGRRWSAALVTMVAATSVLVGCGSESDAEHTIGILRSVAPAADREAAMLEALARAGYASGELRILGADRGEVHPDPADAERTVRAWVADGAEVIVALSTAGAAAARDAAPETPVVVLANDPVASGLVRDARHPEANVTGSSYRVPADRTLAVAADAFAGVDRVGCLYPTGDLAAAPAVEDLRHGAAALGMSVRCEAFTDRASVTTAVETLAVEQVDIVYLVNAPGTVRAYGDLEHALRTVPIPVVANTPNDFATLILEPDGRDVYAQLGRQVARLLDGAAVADVPLQDPGKFLLVVNTVAARRAGVTIPEGLERRADEVVR